MQRKTKQKRAILSVVAFVCVMVAAFFVLGKPLVSFVENPEGFAAWRESRGVWAPLLFMLMVMVQVIVAVIPGEPFEICAGFAFGAVGGTVLTLVGTFLGGVVTFMLVRRFGVRLVELFFPLEKIRSLRFLSSARKRNTLVFLLMMIPGTPKDLLTYFAGLTPLSLREWMLISLIARIPSVVSSTVGGSLVAEQNYLAAGIVFAVTVTVSLVGLLLYNIAVKKQEGALFPLQFDGQGDIMEAEQNWEDTAMSLSNLYTEENLERQRTRYAAVEAAFEKQFGASPTHFFSAPGRSEICGNHTDHNLGMVMAAAIDLDIAAAVSKREDNKVVLASDMFSATEVDISSLAVREEDKGRSAAIIRGVADRMHALGFTVGGFNLYEVSDVLKGSGMSSSAAFEVLICTIFSYLYNDGKLDAVEAAKISQYAENVHFGKPSGLMDQMACSVGGFVEIDFADKDNPIVNPIAFDFASTGYKLVITDCRADHADATDDYADIRKDMAAVAGFFGKECLREITEEQFMQNLGKIRARCGDVAVMRAMHFLEENTRVVCAAAALKAGNFEVFKEQIIASGRSSYMYLQNIYSPSNHRAQAISLGLCVSEKILKPVGGAWRVHGGGFGGTIQAFVPADYTDSYIAAMEDLFGKGCCYNVSVRPLGGYGWRKSK